MVIFIFFTRNTIPSFDPVSGYLPYDDVYVYFPYNCRIWLSSIRDTMTYTVSIRDTMTFTVSIRDTMTYTAIFRTVICPYPAINRRFFGGPKSIKTWRLTWRSGKFQYHFTCICAHLYFLLHHDWYRKCHSIYF